MQTKRFLVGFGVVAVALTSSLPSQAGPDNDAQAKMREALRQKMEALNTTAAPAPAPAAKVETAKPAVAAPAAAAPTVVVPVPVETAAPVAPAPVAKSSSKFSEVPGADDDAAAAKMREALHQKIAAEPAVAPAVATTAAVAAPAKPVAPAPAPAATSVVANPAPEPAIAPAFSGSKQDRLSALLQQYRADQITPQQYHTQRAKIIAEP